MVACKPAIEGHRRWRYIKTLNYLWGAKVTTTSLTPIYLRTDPALWLNLITAPEHLRLRPVYVWVCITMCDCTVSVCFVSHNVGVCVCVCFVVTSMRHRSRQVPKSAELLYLPPPLNSTNQHVFLFVTEVLWDTGLPPHTHTHWCKTPSTLLMACVRETDPPQTCSQEVWTDSEWVSIISAPGTKLCSKSYLQYIGSIITEMETH